jgi:hypothetical protein
MTNAIRSLINSRIKALLAQSDGLANVPHNLTKGELREQLLLDFFSDILPTRYTICSGFVVDSQGHETPQIDFIVAETLDIPRLVLHGAVSLVPFEALRAIVEIKSTIEIGELKDQYNYPQKMDHKLSSKKV